MLKASPSTNFVLTAQRIIKNIMTVVLHVADIRDNKNQRKVSAGFTFIELLLIIAIVLILSVPTAIFSIRLVHQSAVRNATEATKEMLGEAQAQALSGKNNSNWGVKYQHSRIIIFAGDSFASRNTKFDRIFDINDSVVVSGMDEIFFEQISGKTNPQSPTIQIVWGDIAESISINSEGMIK